MSFTVRIQSKFNKIRHSTNQAQSNFKSSPMLTSGQFAVNFLKPHRAERGRGAVDISTDD